MRPGKVKRFGVVQNNITGIRSKTIERTKLFVRLVSVKQQSSPDRELFFPTWAHNFFVFKGLGDLTIDTGSLALCFFLGCCWWTRQQEKWWCDGEVLIGNPAQCLQSPDNRRCTPPSMTSFEMYAFSFSSPIKLVSLMKESVTGTHMKPE